MGDIETASFRSGSDAGTLQFAGRGRPASMPHHDHRIEGVGYPVSPRACARVRARREVHIRDEGHFLRCRPAPSGRGGSSAVVDRSYHRVRR
jgi:hypothetical protein